MDTRAAQGTGRTFIIVIGVLALTVALAGYLANLALNTGLEIEMLEVGSQADVQVEAPAEIVAPVVNTSGIERDLKEAIQAQQVNAETAPSVDATGLERDLKEVVQGQASEQVIPVMDTSGLERDLKDYVRTRTAQ